MAIPVGKDIPYTAAELAEVIKHVEERYGGLGFHHVSRCLATIRQRDAIIADLSRKDPNRRSR